MLESLAPGDRLTVFVLGSILLFWVIMGLCILINYLFIKEK